MLKQAGMCSLRLRFCTLLALLAYAPFWTDGYAHAQESWSYGLRWGGYSPIAKTLLFTATQRGVDLPSQRFLGTYDEEKELIRYLPPTTRVPLDFAWIPGKTAFVVTHRDGMTIFQMDASGKGCSGTAIECPTDFIYNHCAWSPTGRWLAVNCYDIEMAAGPVLGLYSVVEKKFVKSNIPSGNRLPIWKDDSTVYVTNNGDVAEVRLDAQEPKITRTVSFGGDLVCFFWMSEEQALVQMGKKILLGGTTLAELDQVDSRRVIATGTTIFVSPSPTSAVVFDAKGREVARTETEELTLFGSVGTESTMVFGLRGSNLLYIHAEGARLDIKNLCDLSRELPSKPQHNK